MLKYWLWLKTRKGLDNRSILALLRHFSTPEEIYFADEQTCRAVAGVRNPQLLADKDMREAEEILNECYRKQIHILTYQDAAYPERLRNIDDPPVLLYYQGTLPAIDTEPVISVVGTRKATGYGLLQAKQLGYQLGRLGAVVVSGGASGIDTMALKGALSSGRPVIAVLGCGVDVVYPAANRDLFDDIRHHGCLMSEYAPGAPALSEHFPVRNRIMSGLSLGVLVVEAPARSGALITANRALEQGRDVFALPANVGSERSEGNLQLLKDGALLVTEGWDVMKEYVHIYPELVKRQPRTIEMTLTPDEEKLAEVASTKKTCKSNKKQAASAPSTENQSSTSEQNDTKDVDKPEARAYIDVNEILDQLSADERTVVQLLTDKPLPIDEIIDRSQLPAGRVLASITLLEVKGYLTRLPAKRFSLAEKKK